MNRTTTDADLGHRSAEGQARVACASCPCTGSPGCSPVSTSTALSQLLCRRRQIHSARARPLGLPFAVGPGPSHRRPCSICPKPSSGPQAHETDTSAQGRGRGLLRITARCPSRRQGPCPCGPWCSGFGLPPRPHDLMPSLRLKRGDGRYPSTITVSYAPTIALQLQLRLQRVCNRRVMLPNRSSNRCQPDLQAFATGPCGCPSPSTAGLPRARHTPPLVVFFGTAVGPNAPQSQRTVSD